MNGLAYMHNHERLHQSLGPASVILKYMFLFFDDFLLKSGFVCPP